MGKKIFVARAEALEARSLFSVAPIATDAPVADSVTPIHAPLANRATTTPQSTTTTIHLSRRLVKLGQELIVTVAVKAANRKVTPAGTVQLIDGGQTLSLTLTLGKAGRASYALETGNVALYAGGHVLTALYTSSNSLFESISKATFVGVTFPKIKTAADGLGTAIVQRGHGKAVVRAGQTVTVLYTGFLQANGQDFDYATNPSHGAGSPPNLSFVVQASPEQVIAGFDQGVTGMKVGETVLIMIPAGLGYGSSGSGDGSVPANADLAFLVKLQSIT